MIIAAKILFPSFWVRRSLLPSDRFTAFLTHSPDQPGLRRFRVAATAFRVDQLALAMAFKQLHEARVGGDDQVAATFGDASDAVAELVEVVEVVAVAIFG